MVDLGLEDSARRRLTATVQSYQVSLQGHSFYLFV